MLTPKRFIFQFGVFMICFGHIRLSAAPERKQGLYEVTDDVTILNSANFHARVLGTDNAWIVEFYNSWCGHCIHFAPTWKKFATDIKGWRRVVSIGAVDCSRKRNLELCRDYNISAFPTIRFIPPNAVANTFVKSMSGSQSLTHLYQAVVGYITDPKNYTASASWPRLQDVRNLDDVRAEAKSPNKFVMIIFEDENSLTGREVILDLMNEPEVVVRRMLRESAGRFGISQVPSLSVVNKDGGLWNLAVGSGGERDRQTFVDTIRRFLGKSGQETPWSTRAPLEGAGDKTGGVGTTQGPLDHGVEGQELAVHMQDLESALHYCLRQEVAIKHIIDSAGLTALKNFLHVLAKYFPGRQNVRKFLQNVNGWLTTRNAAITGGKWLEKLELLQDDSAYLPETVIWTGCLGSKPGFRGYPCGMWMLFHTLTVSAYLSQKGGNPQEVLLAVRGYMDNFFGCDYCQRNFHKMAVTIESEVTKPEDSVLWLWSGHNSVNKRLHGDLSEDPSHPKEQFPGPDLCPQCLAPGSRPEDPQWNTGKVLDFLVHFYGQQGIVQDVKDGRNPSTAVQIRSPHTDWWEAKQAKADLERLAEIHRRRGGQTEVAYGNGGRSQTKHGAKGPGFISSFLHNQALGVGLMVTLFHL